MSKYNPDIENRMAILNATERLLVSKTLDDIHVVDICSEAHISRPTFYACFKNKNDIVQWHMRTVSEVGSYLVGRTLNWHDGHYITTTGLRNHRLLYLRAGQSPSLDNSIAFGRRLLRNMLIVTIEKFKKVDLTEELKFQVNAYSCAHCDAVDRWLNTGAEMPVDHLVSLLESIAPRQLYELLNSPSVEESDPEGMLFYTQLLTRRERETR